MPVELQPNYCACAGAHLSQDCSEKVSRRFPLITSTNRLPLTRFAMASCDDLFYRISTITIHVPPLRERMKTFSYSPTFPQAVRRKIPAAEAPLSHSRLFNVCLPTYGPASAELQRLEAAVLLAKGDRVEPVDLPLIWQRQCAPVWPGVPPNMTL